MAIQNNILVNNQKNLPMREKDISVPSQIHCVLTILEETHSFLVIIPQNEKKWLSGEQNRCKI